MYKVLIVDDEPAIRAGLQTILNWRSHGFAVIGDASNGREALAKCQELQPDLLVIDIRMPGMDGLQVVEELRRMGNKCRVLILSGYAEFNYAREAIIHGVDGYLLKPMDEEELAAELLRVKAHLDRETDLTRRTAGSTAIRREELIQALTVGSADEPPSTAAAELRSLLGQPLWRSYQVVLLEVYVRHQEERELSWASNLKRVWSEAVEQAGLGCLFSVEAYMGILLKEDISSSTLRKSLAQRLKEWAGDTVEFTGAAGGSVRSLEQLASSYEEALQLIKRSFLLSSGEIYDGQEDARFRNEPSSGAEIPGYPSTSKGFDLEHLAVQLFYALDLGSREGVEEALQEAGAQITGADSSEQAVKQGFAQLLTLVFNKLILAHSQEIVQEYTPLVAELYGQVRYEELMELLTSRLVKLATKLCNESNVPVMKQMLDFINRHYSENLKLETLADIFKYNSGYLGKMFKQYTGENFNTYLDKLRINRAIELLGEGLKVHQVADRVGYANVDYFHSKFKKYVGVSPSSFKGQSSKATPTK